MKHISILIMILTAAVGTIAAEFDRPYIFGTQVLDEGRLEEMLIELRKYGGTQSRVGTCWWNNEQEPGQGYDFAEVDEKVDLHLKHGISLLLNVATVPLWASEAPPEAVKILEDRGHNNLVGTFMVSPNRMEEYTRWVEAVAKHFRDRIDYYEIWNEPDGMAGPIIHYGPSGEIEDVWYGGDPAAFTRVLKAAYTALHKYDPGCTVVACSLESKTAFLKGIYEAGGKGYFDAVAIHPYGEPLNRNWIQDIRDLMVEWGDGDKGIWVTEYGWGFGDKPGMVKEGIRWGRETEYMTALHIHLANHLFRNNKVGEGPLKPSAGLIAFKQAVEEEGPRDALSYDFEGACPVEWRFRADRAEGSRFGCTSDMAHNGTRALRASTEGVSVSLHCNAYVKDSNSTLTFWSYVPPESGTPVSLSVTTTPGSPIAGADRTLELIEEGGGHPAGEWVKNEVRLTGIDSYLAGRTLMNVTITASSGSEGLSLYVDDFSITPGSGTVKPAGERPSSVIITAKDYVDRPVILGPDSEVALSSDSGVRHSLTPDATRGLRSGKLRAGWYRVFMHIAGHAPFEQKFYVKSGIEKEFVASLNPEFNMVKNADFESKGWGGPEGDQVGVGTHWETVCGGMHPEIYDVTDLARYSGKCSQRMTSEGYNIDFSTDPSRCFHLSKIGERVFHPVTGVKLGNQAIAQVIETPVVPGEEYQLSAWVKIQRLMAHWEWFRLGIYWLDGEGKFIGESRESEENKGNIDRHDWKLITCRGVAPEGTVKAKVYLHHHFEHGVVWYDDVCFAPVTDIER